MIHSIVEKYKVHSGHEIVVPGERFVQKLLDLRPVSDREVFGITDTFREVTVDKGLFEHYVFVIILMENVIDAK